MEKYRCECRTTFYRYPKKLTVCPNCIQVVVDLGIGDNVQTIKVFRRKDES